MLVEDVLARYRDQLPDECYTIGQGSWLRLDAQASHSCQYRLIQPFLYKTREEALASANRGHWPCALFDLESEQGWRLTTRGWEVGEEIETLIGCYEERLQTLIGRHPSMLGYDVQRAVLGDYYIAEHNHVCGLADRGDGTYDYTFGYKRGDLWGRSKFDIFLIVNLDSGKAEEPNGRKVGKSTLRYATDAEKGPLAVIRTLRQGYPDYDGVKIAHALPRKRYIVVGSQAVGPYGYVGYTAELSRTLEGALSEWRSELVPEEICDLETGVLSGLMPCIEVGERILGEEEMSPQGEAVAALLGI